MKAAVVSFALVAAMASLSAQHDPIVTDADGQVRGALLPVDKNVVYRDRDSA